MNLKNGDQLNAKEIRRLFPKEVYELLVIISREGFSLTLVGGAVRDWVVSSELSRDLDFELRHTFDYDESDWTFRINRLGERLREVYHYKVEFLSFSILRICWEGLPYDVELAPARIETFADQADYGHSDFSAKLVSNTPYQETFKRRDFTLNAMGIELRSPETEDEFLFIDPFGGFEDLKDRVLRPCSDDFYKDPVRFCRAIRFHHLFQCQFSEELKKQFPKFNLEQLSEYYFFREAFKGDFFAFVDTFYDEVESNQIKLSSSLKDLKFLKGKGKYHLHLRNPEQVLLYLIYACDIDEKDLMRFCELAKVKRNQLSGHIGFKQTLNDLTETSAVELKSLAKLKPKEFIKQEKVPLLLSFHQFMSKNSKESLKALGRIDPSLYKTFLALYDLLPSSLEGKELFEALIEDPSFSPKERGKLMLYAHLVNIFQIPY